MGKIFNALVNIVHTHTDSSFSFEFEHLHSLLFSFIVSEYHLESSRSVYDKICSLVLVSKSMSANYDWFFPAWDQFWNVLDDDWLSENCTIHNVSDCTVRALPHFLKIKLFDSCLIWSNSCAFNTHLALFNRSSCINSDLIICCISVLYSQVKVFNLEIQEWQYELVLNVFPNYSGHFITIEFSNWILNLNFFKLHQKNIYNLKLILYWP